MLLMFVGRGLMLRHGQPQSRRAEQKTLKKSCASKPRTPIYTYLSTLYIETSLGLLSHNSLILTLKYVDFTSMPKQEREERGKSP
jgi:hypothetical protein